MNESLNYTVYILQRFMDPAPPFVPVEREMEFTDALRQAREEAMLIRKAKPLWPYIQAYRHMLDSYERKFSDSFFLPRLNQSARLRYSEFKEYGGSFFDVKSGKAAFFFTPEDRLNIIESLISSKQDLQQYARQAVHSVDRKVYEDKIQECINVFVNIEEAIERLMLLSADAKDQSLASEITEYVRMCDHGLCGLTKLPDRVSLFDSLNHFLGRQKERRYR